MEYAIWLKPNENHPLMLRVNRKAAFLYRDIRKKCSGGEDGEGSGHGHQEDEMDLREEEQIKQPLWSMSSDSR